MKKHFTIALVLFVFTNFIKAQTWDSVGCSGLWSECGGFSGEVDCLGVYNGSLFAGGSSYTAGNLVINNIGQWNGNKWDSLLGGINICFETPSAMAVYSGNLYVGGSFTDMNGITCNNIAMWNGSSWSTVGNGTDINGSISAMVVYNGNLYVGGLFDSIGGVPVNNIAMWNGSSWSAAGTGVTGGGWTQPYIYALCVYNGKLYAGGMFDSAGSIPAYKIASWDGLNWSSLSSGIDSGRVSLNYNVKALSVYNGNLYVGGYFDTAGHLSVNNIAIWNGVSWSRVGAGITGAINYNFGTYYRITAMQVYNGNLYVGGCFDTAGGIPVNNIATWDGTNWNYIPGFKGGINNPPFVSSFAVYNGYLFAGGNFDTAGGVPTWNIAGNNGLTGINNLTANSGSVSLYPNPSQGVFTIAMVETPRMASLQIYNMMGQKIFTETLRSAQGDNSINISNQPDGIYLYRVLGQDGGLIGEGKLIIQK